MASEVLTPHLHGVHTFNTGTLHTLSLSSGLAAMALTAAPPSARRDTTGTAPQRYHRSDSRTRDHMTDTL
jgi:hypothetical protein